MTQVFLIEIRTRKAMTTTEAKIYQRVIQLIRKPAKMWSTIGMIQITKLSKNQCKKKKRVHVCGKVSVRVRASIWLGSIELVIEVVFNCFS